MSLKYELGQKVKLNEDGLKDIMRSYGVKEADYQNQEAEIVKIYSSSDYQYDIRFGDENVFGVSEKLITPAFAENNEKSEEQSVVKGYFETMGSEIGELVDRKQLAYGNSVDKTYRLMKIFLEKWGNGDGTYTIPESLLKHMLLQVRLIDKQNRLFNNPDSDLMQENPYQDSVGYSMLGVRMVEESK